MNPLCLRAFVASRKITKKLATKLQEGKKVEVKVEVENFLTMVFKKCPKGKDPLHQ
jgi:hypothetical protein